MPNQQQNETGSLIQIHYHDNLELLQRFTEEQYNILSKFNYTKASLTFDNKKVALESDDASIENMVNQVWQDIDNDSNYGWFNTIQGEETT